jgi:hypothetical protein
MFWKHKFWKRTFCFFKQLSVNHTAIKQPFSVHPVNLFEVDVPKKAVTLAAINLQALQQARIQGILLDLDNTIVSEDDRYISPGAEFWIQTAKQLGFSLFILSNGKRRHRVRAWSERLEVPAISPARKPFPGSFRKALQRMHLFPEQVIVIGDSLHTDVLGAWIIGCPCIQVASLPHPPRWWEKLLGRWVQISYPKDQELWEL